MNKIFFTLPVFVISLQLYAQVSFTALGFSPQYPQANSKISFEYNANLSPLIRQKNVTVVVYLFNGKGEMGCELVEPMMKNNGGIYKGSVQIDSSTSAIALSFFAGEQKDNNNDKAYIIPIYEKNKTPLERYYLLAGKLEDAYGNVVLRKEMNSTKGLAYLEEAIRLFPDSKTKLPFLGQYLYLIDKVKKNDALSIIRKELGEFEKRSNIDEAGYNMLIDWYAKMSMKEKADSLTIVMKSIYPIGDYQIGEYLKRFEKEPDMVKTRILFDSLVAKFASNKNNTFIINKYRGHLAKVYTIKQDIKNYKELVSQMDKAEAMKSYNSTAWTMAEKGENLILAKEMAHEATMYAKAEIINPTQHKPYNFTSKKWDEDRKKKFAMFGDTYAFILYQLGDYNTGLSIAKDAANIHKLQMKDYNERYALLAEKAMQLKDAKKLIEGFVKNGTATNKTKESLKNLYKKEKRTEIGFDIYLAKIESTGKEIVKAKLLKTILNDPSPKFVLNDIDGKEVSLGSLKGKIIVVDFWATWCGPCIASMPGMNKALAKYKTNENVHFLFVNTLETVKDKLTNAKDFMNKNKYDFQVLLDMENKMAGDFKVDAIPTKFIIDKEGKIRFKAVGFPDNDDELVDELSMMIELASE